MYLPGSLLLRSGLRYLVLGLLLTCSWLLGHFFNSMVIIICSDIQYLIKNVVNFSTPLSCIHNLINSILIVVLLAGCNSVLYLVDSSFKISLQSSDSELAHRHYVEKIRESGWN